MFTAFTFLPITCWVVGLLIALASMYGCVSRARNLARLVIIRKKGDAGEDKHSGQIYF